MTQGPDYLIFITDNKGKYYYVDQYGTVLLSTTPRPLKVSPDGWQEISILNERNKKYWGLDRSFTIPLKWVEDGARIIKTLYYTNGAEASASIIIVQQYLDIDGSYYDFRYRLLYRGEPDLTTFTHEGAVVTTNCIEGGLAKLIKASENTTYQIPCEEVTVKHDGVNLEQTGNLFIVPGIDVQRRQVSVGNPVTNVNNIFLPMALAGVDGISTGVEFQGVTQAAAPGAFTDKIASDSWFAKVDDNIANPITFNIVGNIAFTCTNNNSGAGFRMRFLRSGMTLAEQDTLKLHPDTFALTVGQSYQFVINMTVTLQPGERLLLEGIFVGGVGGSSTTVLQFKDTGLMSASYLNRFRATNVKAVSLYTIFATIVQKMTNGAYGFSSDILTANNKKIVATSGDALRGIAEPNIKTTLSNAFDAANVIPEIGPVGMGIIGNNLVLKPLAEWLKGEIIDLGEVGALKATDANEYRYNRIRAGYAVEDDGNLNGRDEFNTTTEYSTANERSPKTLELLSPWKAGIYEIENNRINLSGKTTTDDTSDNSVFLLATDGVGNLDRSLNSGAIGVIDPTGIYNIGLSPARIVYSWGAFIKSFMRGQEATWLKFQVTDKNSKLVAAGVAESGNIMVSSLPDPLFIPTFHEFEAAPVDDYFALVQANPIRRFKYTYDGVTMTGIAMRSGIQPGRVHTFQCLADPSNDPIKEIEIDG